MHSSLDSSLTWLHQHDTLTAPSLYSRCASAAPPLCHHCGRYGRRDTARLRPIKQKTTCKGRGWGLWLLRGCVWTLSLHGHYINFKLVAQPILKKITFTQPAQRAAVVLGRPHSGGVPRTHPSCRCRFLLGKRTGYNGHRGCALAWKHPLCKVLSPGATQPLRKSRR